MSGQLACLHSTVPQGMVAAVDIQPVHTGSTEAVTDSQPCHPGRKMASARHVPVLVVVDSPAAGKRVRPLFVRVLLRLVGGATKGAVTTTGGTCSTTALEGTWDQPGLADMLMKDRQLVGVH